MSKVCFTAGHSKTGAGQFGWLIVDGSVEDSWETRSEWEERNVLVVEVGVDGGWGKLYPRRETWKCVYVFNFWLHPLACGTLVFHQGLNPAPPALEGRVLTTDIQNHWKVPESGFGEQKWWWRLSCWRWWRKMILGVVDAERGRKQVVECWV